MSEAVTPSAFDIESFFQSSVEGANSTVRIPISPGDYPAVIADAKDLSLQLTPNKGVPVLEIHWTLDSEEEARKTGREKLRVRQSVYLDVILDGNNQPRLDMGKGKNVQLGRLREAVGQNSSGPWSFGRLVGAMAKVKVDLAPNPKVPGDFYENVAAVTKL